MNADGSPVRFLEDVRVLEIASLAPTQLGMHLADLGAEVIKIEPPGQGDATRLTFKRPGFNDSGLHRRWNRGKRSVAIDTRTSEGVELIKRLISTVDVVIEGLRPDTLAKMGLGKDVLLALKPNLVVVALSGYGQTGPYRNLPSHGVAFDAVSGLADVADDAEGRPVLASRHVNYGTLLGPLYGASSALAALSWSRRTGQPVFLDIAQADAAAFANLAVESAAAERGAVASGAVKSAAPEARTSAPPTISPYRTRDGKLLMMMALERKFFVRLADVTGRTDLLAFAPEDRYIVQNTVEIDEALREILASKDIADWMAIFAAADVPVVPINDSVSVTSDPQMKARIEWLGGDQGTVTMKTPVRAEPAIASPSPAPSLGQDTSAVLKSIGVDEAELNRLIKEGVVRA
jgi:crotonobetainyl-CoA:carnitine CoA-transferase CaiB-like acyl-CoA transferase